MRRRLVTLAAVLIAASAHAQSFDCRKARTETDKSVCADPRLAGLDYETGRRFREALRHRRTTLAEHLRWIAKRNADCAADAACLAGAYRARLTELRPAADDAARKAPCDAFATAYAQADEAGRARMLSEADSGRLDVAAVAPPLQGRKALEALTGAPRLDRLPGAEVYARSSLAGTLECFQSDHVFWRRSDGDFYIAPPEGWELTGAEACVRRSFGAAGGRPAAFTRIDSANGLTASFSLSLWAGDHFADACTVQLAFAPNFDNSASPGFVSRFAKPDDCKDEACRALRGQVAGLLEKIQAGPAQALMQAQSRLNDEQRRLFVEWVKGQEKPAPDDLSDPMRFDERHPLYAPLLHEGRLYFAEITHPVARVTSPDWDVSLEAQGGGESFAFFLHMSPGRLVGARAD